MTIFSHTVVPVKLNSSNFDNWYLKVNKTLKEKGVKKYVESDFINDIIIENKKRQSLGLPTVEITNHIKNDTQAIQIITKSLSPELAPIIINFQTSFRMMEKLKREYIENYEGNSINLYSKLTNIKASNITESVKIIDELNKIFKQLDIAEEPITDNEKSKFFYSSISEDAMEHFNVHLVNNYEKLCRYFKLSIYMKNMKNNPDYKLKTSFNGKEYEHAYNYYKNEFGIDYRDFHGNEIKRSHSHSPLYSNSHSFSYPYTHPNNTHSNSHSHYQSHSHNHSYTHDHPHSHSHSHLKSRSHSNPNSPALSSFTPLSPVSHSHKHLNSHSNSRSRSHSHSNSHPNSRSNSRSRSYSHSNSHSNSHSHSRSSSHSRSLEINHNLYSENKKHEYKEISKCSNHSSSSKTHSSRSSSRSNSLNSLSNSPQSKYSSTLETINNSNSDSFYNNKNKIYMQKKSKYNKKFKEEQSSIHSKNSINDDSFYIVEKALASLEKKIK